METNALIMALSLNISTPYTIHMCIACVKVEERATHVLLEYPVLAKIRLGTVSDVDSTNFAKTIPCLCKIYGRAGLFYRTFTQ